MEDVIAHYRQVIYSEPRHYKLLDWFCLSLIIFCIVYGSVFYLLTRNAVQGVTLPDASYTPTQQDSPKSSQLKTSGGLPVLIN